MIFLSAASLKSRFATALVFCCLVTSIAAAEEDPFPQLEQDYRSQILPLLKTYCLECHSTEAKEGELDLQRFAKLADIRRDPKPWPGVVEMVGTKEMPPEDSKQPTAEERQKLVTWAKNFVDAEARARAGDPGPVVLRRLNNAEFNYSISDLTGVKLEPAKEFPADGAAGEGFTNAGNALAMSPALVQKYLDAGHAIAEHAVLLPDGVRFSPYTTRRDWSNDLVTQIRLIYARNTSGESDTSLLNRWGADPLKSSENDGRVDLPKYFAALLKNKDRLAKEPSAIAEIAKAEKLNAKYLGILNETLRAKDPESLLLEQLRKKFAAAGPNDAASLANDVKQWQQRLWSFNSVGHLGLIRPWQAGLVPAVDAATVKYSLPQTSIKDITLYLAANSFGDGTNDDALIWQRPRIEFKDRSPILLAELQELARRLDRVRTTELARTAKYLEALVELRSGKQSAEQLAVDRDLDPALLAAWVSYTSLGQGKRPELTGHMPRKAFKVSGYDDINGWALNDLPCLLTNRSKDPISFLTLTVPGRGVTIHPNPTQAALVAWKAPRGGSFKPAFKIADADNKCGNGSAWQVERWSLDGVQMLQHGTFDNGKTGAFEPDATFDLQSGDLLLLVISARDRDHSCDTTHVEFTIEETTGDKQKWNLATDIIDNIHDANPHADSHGNDSVWHFCVRDEANPKEPKKLQVPAGSVLDKWRQAVLAEKSAEELKQLAAAVQQLAVSKEPTRDVNGALHGQLTDFRGVLNWPAVKRLDEHDPTSASDKAPVFGLDPDRFGKHPLGKQIDPTALYLVSERVLEVKLPAALVAGGEFVSEVRLDFDQGVEATAQPIVDLAKPENLEMPHPAAFILTRNDSPGRRRLAKSCEDFRQIFPVAMCYARIVPVDETVTLLLYHREDEPLRRLMLNDAERARLDRLWQELHFVSQDELRVEVALEQILEFATQDADPKRFDPLLKPIADNAAKLRAELVSSEPAQWQALVDFAGKAYRRPLKESEAAKLKQLYEALRAEGLSHEDAWRTTFARVVSSPSFLYRLEKPGPAKEAVEVSDLELASRLSFFLWSSLPDEELLAAAKVGTLNEPAILRVETRRMLQDDRTRRLAVEFACTWLHIRDFDELDEKSERHFPQFAEFRGDMYEESIRYFDDLFRRDGSVLEILDSDHTFLNERLAKFYGIEGVKGDEWRRVDGVKKNSRGGILTQATTLASQSGASRTSPILRGNWIAETILGERLPRPPKNVPQLPADEADLAGLTVRQITEKHTTDPACNKCHKRIDPYGFALEAFDTIGRLREKDLGGHAIDTTTTVMDGTKLDGVDGLRNYLVNTRRDAFLRQFNRKLLGFALGRGVQLSDEPLLAEMAKNLAEKDYKFSAAVETIVVSPQFRMIRGNLAEE